MGDKDRYGFRKKKKQQLRTATFFLNFFAQRVKQ